MSITLFTGRHTVNIQDFQMVEKLCSKSHSQLFPVADPYTIELYTPKRPFRRIISTLIKDILQGGELRLSKDVSIYLQWKIEQLILKTMRITKNLFSEGQETLLLRDFERALELQGFNYNADSEETSS